MSKIKDIVNLTRKARLYARVGLKGVTLSKFYVMVRYWILTNVFKKAIPWLVEFSVTYRCQCKCPHCSVGDYLDKGKQKDELTNDQIKGVLTQISEMGIPKVDFFGGEPLIKEGIADLIEFGAKKGLYMSVTTNAWLLTKEKTKELKRAGISCINISLDNTSEELHDRLRGLPGFTKSVRWNTVLL